MSLSIKGTEIRDQADSGAAVEGGTRSHREATHAAQEHAQRASRGAKSVGFPDTPEVEAAFDSLRKGRKGAKPAEETADAQETEDNPTSEE